VALAHPVLAALAEAAVVARHDLLRDQPLAELEPAAPAIHFGTDTGSLLELQRDAGGSVIGLDWRVDLARSWKRLGSQVAVQGNLDPVVLFADLPEIERQTRRILEQAGGRPGHIFNLGHGILPQTPVDHVRALVDMVHNLSQSTRYTLRGHE